MALLRNQYSTGLRPDLETAGMGGVELLFFLFSLPFLGPLRSPLEYRATLGG